MIVDLLPTEDQQSIQSSVSGYLGRSLPITRLRAQTLSAAAEIEHWNDLAELGLFGLGVAQEAGGVGYTIAEEIVVALELGRYLISPSVLATMISVHFADEPLRQDLISGKRRVALANRLSGAMEEGYAELHLLDARNADLILVWTDKGAALYEHEPSLETPLSALDESMSLSRRSGELGEAVCKISGPATGLHAALLLAAYLTGNADATLSMAVEYAKVREQFNQPIGAFQAIKHYCADMALRVEAASSQTRYAAILMAADPEKAGFDVYCARYLASSAAVNNARFNIQIHGGMGFTYEADAHWYLKRALLISALSGGPRQDQARIIEANLPGG